MKIASFFAYTGPGRVCIARWAPRNTPAGFRIYKPLAPRRDMLKMTLEQYRRIYVGEILAALDPQTVVDDIHGLAGDCEPVMLCWEQTADIASGKTFCHRHMVAEWLAETLGLDVPEIGAG